MPRSNSQNTNEHAKNTSMIHGSTDPPDTCSALACAGRDSPETFERNAATIAIPARVTLADAYRRDQFGLSTEMIIPIAASAANAATRCTTTGCNGTEPIITRRQRTLAPVHSLESDLDLALRLADLADPVTMSRYRASDLVVESKPDLTPVTEADQAAERVLRSELAVARPDDAILGEEYGTSSPGHTARLWILDPIDGTKNYVRGVPAWATLIALTINGVPVLGVASAPALGRRWWAAEGLGAWTKAPEYPQSHRLQVSAVSDLADASFSFSDSQGWAERGANLSALDAATWRTRAYGDFWSHLLVAEGSVDVAAEPELAKWDIAALVPIVTEAGGRLTAFDGTDALDGGCALTTNGALHDAVIAKLNEA